MKINSGNKGKRNEREIVAILNERFKKIISDNPDWGSFSRTLGSGNRYATANLGKFAEDAFAGDIAAPTNLFNFVIESKSGYNHIDLEIKKMTELDKFLEQVESDSTRINKQSLLIWKKDRRSRIAAVKLSSVPDIKFFEYYMVYREWLIVPLDELLKLGDDYFFSNI